MNSSVALLFSLSHFLEQSHRLHPHFLEDSLVSTILFLTNREHSNNNDHHVDMSPTFIMIRYHDMILNPLFFHLICDTSSKLPS